MKIHFFDPFSNIWPHSFPIARVMARFTSLGHNVEVVRCTGAFSTHCVAMAGSKVDFDSPKVMKKLVCRTCRKRSELIDDVEVAKRLSFDNEIEPGDLISARLIAEKATPENWSDLEYDGVPVGKIASYEVFLTHKIDSIQIPMSVWPEFQANLLNTVLVVIIAKRILIQAKPDRVIVYNSLYALNNAYTSVADLLGIPTFTLQGGPHILRRPSTLTCFCSPKEMFLTTYSKEASDWLLLPSDNKTIALASEHLQNLLIGDSAFSYSVESSLDSKSRIPKLLSIDSKRPVLVALLSSEDEFFAADLVGAIPRIENWRIVFSGQNEWIKWLIQFAERHPELDLVIRVHPRLLPNKREGKLAPYVHELENLLSKTPSNVKVNWPYDEISLYDLMQYTDVALNRRSTAGLEMLAYGIPVVLPGDEFLFSSPPDICSVAKDAEDYERLILKALDDGWSLDNVRKAFRWLGFIFDATTVDVLEVKNSKISTVRPKKSQLMIKIWRHLAFVYVQSGILRAERKQLLNVDRDLEGLNNLVETVVNLSSGIHIPKGRKAIFENTFDKESRSLLEDLEVRLHLLNVSKSHESPLQAKFNEAKKSLSTS